MSLGKVLKALAKTGATTLIAGLSQAGPVGAITAGVLAGVLGIDKADPELNEKIIAASETKAGRAKILEANLQLEQRKAELFTDVQLAQIDAATEALRITMEAASDIISAELESDNVAITQTNLSYRKELESKYPRIATTRPDLARYFFRLIVFICGTVFFAFVLDALEVFFIVAQCQSEACYNYYAAKPTFVAQLSGAWNALTILKLMGGAVVTWFGSRGVEKSIERFKTP